MSVIKQKKANLVFPANAPISNQEMTNIIKEAEKGPFYTSAQVKQALKKWSKKYSR